MFRVITILLGLPTAMDAAAAAAGDTGDGGAAALTAEEAELAAKQADAARKEKILAAALAEQDVGESFLCNRQAGPENAGES